MRKVKLVTYSKDWFAQGNGNAHRSQVFAVEKAQEALSAAQRFWYRTTVVEVAVLSRMLPTDKWTHTQFNAACFQVAREIHQKDHRESVPGCVLCQGGK